MGGAHAASPFFENATQGDRSRSEREKIRRYTKALELWTRADRVDDKAAVFVRRGASYMQVGDLEKALADMDSAAALMPKDWIPRSGRADVLAAMRRCDDSAKEYAVAMAGAPEANRAVILHGRGIMYRDCKKDLEAAVRNFEAAIVAASKAGDDMQLAQSASARGAVRCGQKQFQEGLENVAQAIRVQPRGADFHFDLGLCKEGAGDWKGAYESFSKAIEIVDPSGTYDPSANDELELERKTVGSTAVTAREDRKKLGDCYFHRGVVSRKLKNGKAALSDLKRACRLGSRPACQAAKKSN